MRIAITGTVGSGKSGVAALLAAALNAEWIDSDAVCRQLLLPGQTALQELKEQWRGRFFQEDGRLDRVMLREAAFAEPAVRKELENVLHRRVREKVEERARLAAESGHHLLVEVPLLFEVGWQDDFDRVVAVYTPVQQCIARTASRDKVSRGQVEAILALQLSPEEKAARADWVVNNAGIWTATVLQVSALARHLQLA